MNALSLCISGISCVCASIKSCSPHSICDTLILFCVNVPVLSEHMMDMVLNVSMVVKSLTSTLCACIFLAVNPNVTVTDIGNPSGTYATIIEMTLTMIPLVVRKDG